MKTLYFFVVLVDAISVFDVCYKFEEPFEHILSDYGDQNSPSIMAFQYLMQSGSAPSFLWPFVETLSHVSNWRLACFVAND